MALTEQTVLAAIEIKPQLNTIDVRWDNQVLRDGEIIASTPHRKAYSESQKAEFLIEVDGGQAYVDAIGWQ